MAEHPDRSTDRRRELQGILQDEYPGCRIVVESVATGGFDGFLIWASQPGEGKRSVVHQLARQQLVELDVADVAVAVRTAITAAFPAAQP